MRTTIMEWRVTIEWDGDSPEVATHKGRQLLDLLITGNERAICQIIGRAKVAGGLEGRAICLQCGCVGTEPSDIEHEMECTP